MMSSHPRGAPWTWGKDCDARDYNMAMLDALGLGDVYSLSVARHLAFALAGGGCCSRQHDIRLQW
jgi:hypothetical protein